MTTYHYACVCGATGSDDTKNKTDAASPSGKHMTTCAGPLLTSTIPAALQRMVEAVGK